MTEHRSPQVRMQQILSAARTCFIQRGYFQTKVLDIANEAGLSKGGIYFHFSSKREIFRVLVEREYNTAIFYLDQVISSETSMVEKLANIGQHFIDLFSNDDQSKFMITICEMALRDEEVGKMCRELQNHYYERIHSLLVSAEQAGELNPVHTKSIAIILKSLMDGLQINIAIMGLEVDIPTFIESGIIMITQGILKQS